MASGKLPDRPQQKARLLLRARMVGLFQSPMIFLYVDLTYTAITTALVKLMYADYVQRILKDDLRPFCSPKME